MEVKLYVWENHKESDSAKELLERNDVKFSEIDIEKMGLVSYIGIDLGINKFPALVSSSGTYVGLPSIHEFIKKNSF